MAKYYVTYKVEGRYIAEVEADSLEEAQKEAESEYESADFGELEDIGACGNTKQICVETEHGDIIWEG